MERRAMQTGHVLPQVSPASEKEKERTGYHDAVVDFKRSLIETTLRQTEGNRTRAAKFLGLQRTYLLRLMRDLQVKAPPGRGVGRSLFEPALAREERGISPDPKYRARLMPPPGR